MNHKVYRSYEEIDKDLEILKLEKEIAYKKLSFAVEKTTETLTPSNMLLGVLGNVGATLGKYGILQNVVLPLILRRFQRK